MYSSNELIVTTGFHMVIQIVIVSNDGYVVRKLLPWGLGSNVLIYVPEKVHTGKGGVNMIDL